MTEHHIVDYTSVFPFLSAEIAVVTNQMLAEAILSVIDRKSQGRMLSLTAHLSCSQAL